mgnify:CR=1 FL=1
MHKDAKPVETYEDDEEEEEKKVAVPPSDEEEKKVEEVDLKEEAEKPAEKAGL